MKKIILTVFLISAFISAHSQILSPSIGGGISGMVEREVYPVITFGVEASNSGHWSIVGQFLMGGKNNLLYHGIVTDKRMWGMELDTRFYFREVQNGFFLSGGAFFGRENIIPRQGYNGDPIYIPSPEQAGMAFGLGFSQKINEAISVQLGTSMGINFMNTDNARLRAGLGISYNLIK